MKATIAAVIIVACMIVSCASRDVVVRGEPLTLPERPERVSVTKPTDESAGIIGVEKPAQLKPLQRWRAPEGGALCWQSKDWRILDQVLKRHYTWAESVEKLVERHNKRAETNRESKTEEGVWWKIW